MDNKNWWDQAKFPDFGFNSHNVPWYNWAPTVLFKMALIENQQVYHFEEDFPVKPGGVFLQKLNSLNCRLIWASTDNSNLSVVESNQNIYINNNTLLSVSSYEDDSYSIRVDTLDKELYNKLLQIIKEERVPKLIGKSVYVLVMSTDGPNIVKAGEAHLPLERGNYEPSVIEDFDYIVNQMNSKEPYGRLVIFNGQPGSGKTHLIRGLLDEIKGAIFVLIQPDLLSQLAGPQLIQPILDINHGNDEKNKSPLVLILEDADRCLVPRGSDNLGEISSLLNFGDGILGTMFDMRIIATTNAAKLEIDKALVRPGRLCRMSNVESLSAETANKAYERLTSKPGPFTNKAPIADVYQKASQNGWLPADSRHKIGF